MNVMMNDKLNSRRLVAAGRVVRWCMLVLAAVWAGGAGEAQAQSVSGPVGAKQVSTSKLSSVNLGGDVQDDTIGCSPMWINTSVNTYWETEFAFTDLFKLSDNWHNGNLQGHDVKSVPALKLDANGWVTELATNNTMNTQIARTYILGPDGAKAVRAWSPQLVVKWEGQGDIAFTGAKVVWGPWQNRMVIELNQPSAGQPHDTLIMEITKIPNPWNYPRNITVKAASQEWVTDLFNPIFIEKLQPFKGIRFMNSGRTNTYYGDEAYEQRWSDRPLPTDIRYSDEKRGWPLEVMAELCNQLGKGMWYCVHHTADDEYVQNAAGLINSTLWTGLQVVVEHSNEVWNDIFEQAYDCEAKGFKIWPAMKRSGVDKFEVRMKYHTLRTVQIGQIFKDVMQGYRPVTRMLALGIPTPFWTDKLLGWEGTAWKVDAVSVAPYFGGKYNNQNYQWWSVDQLMDDIIWVDVPSVISTVAQHKSMMLKHNPDLKLWFYEWGQHLVAHPAQYGNVPLNKLMDDAQKHWKMELAYEQLAKGLLTMEPVGMAHFVFASPVSKYGRWGALESLFQDPQTSPKYKALQKVMECP
jgi:hypothetical protein